MYKLRDWIDINKLDWKYLSMNLNAKNPNSLHLLKKNRKYSC